MTVFQNAQFGEIRTLDENGKVLFCGNDIAKALGYARANDAITVHCRSTVKRRIPHPQSKEKQIEMSFIPEGDVYRLITQNRKGYFDAQKGWKCQEKCSQKTPKIMVNHAAGGVLLLLSV